jgi:hypothetical protein
MADGSTSVLAPDRKKIKRFEKKMSEESFPFI